MLCVCIDHQWCSIGWDMLWIEICKRLNKLTMLNALGKDFGCVCCCKNTLKIIHSSTSVIRLFYLLQTMQAASVYLWDAFRKQILQSHCALMLVIVRISLVCHENDVIRRIVEEMHFIFNWRSATSVQLKRVRWQHRSYCEYFYNFDSQAYFQIELYFFPILFWNDIKLTWNSHFLKIF